MDPLSAALGAILPELLKGGAELVRDAIDGDVKARAKLLDVIGSGQGRLKVERALDDAMIASLPEG